MKNPKIKLDKTDRKILAELDKNCRIPLTHLAKKVRKSRQSVEYRINQLIEKKVILSFNTSINPYKMGYKVYKLYLQLKNIREDKERLLSFINTCGKVYWYGEGDGEWNLVLGIFAKSDYDFYNLKNETLSKFSKIIIKHRGDILLDSKQYSKMYFTDKLNEPVTFGGEIINYELKTLDKQILKELVNNARIPLTELAKKVRSTPIIIKNRIKNLEKTGVILQYRISVNLGLLGLEFFKSILSIETQEINDEKKFTTYLSQMSITQYVIRNLWGMEIEVVVNSYSEYNQFINNIKKDFPDLLKGVETMIMKSDVWIPSLIM